MAEESYEQRIKAAQNELERALGRRDQHYPGSTEWEAASGEVRNWLRVIDDLRQGQAS